MVSGRCFYLDRFILTILLTAWPAAGVLQPTRASIMTGRTHQRDCINFALSCDQEDPASTCAAGNEGALPTTEFTFANAAKVLQTRHHSGPFLTRFSRVSQLDAIILGHPGAAVCTPLGFHAYRMLIGPCDPMSCPIPQASPLGNCEPEISINPHVNHTHWRHPWRLNAAAAARRHQCSCCEQANTVLLRVDGVRHHALANLHSIPPPPPAPASQRPF